MVFIASRELSNGPRSFVAAHPHSILRQALPVELLVEVVRCSLGVSACLIKTSGRTAGRRRDSSAEDDSSQSPAETHQVCLVKSTSSNVQPALERSLHGGDAAHAALAMCTNGCNKARSSVSGKVIC